MTSRSWMFTIFDENWDHACLSHERVARAAVQKEKAPETGREHFQGFVSFKSPCRMTMVKTILKCDAAHCEVAKGSPQQSWAYCTKEDTRIDGPWTYGEPPTGSGARNDLKRAWELIKEGASDVQLFEEVPAVAFKYRSGIAAARMAVVKSRDPNVTPQVSIYWGDSGTGKTRKALDENPGAYIVTKPNVGGGALWFDGYAGEEVMIIDEFYGWIQYDFFLRLLDRYPLKLQVKGGFVECLAHRFVITSNKCWKDWYPNIEDKSALERRIREFGNVVHFNGPLRPSV